jgi:hypothetical protein
MRAASASAETFVSPACHAAATGRPGARVSTSPQCGYRFVSCPAAACSALAEEVEVGVQLADHGLGDGLADLVLVGFLRGDAMGEGVVDGGSGEGGGGAGAAAVVDEREDMAGKGEAITPAGGLAVEFGGRAESVDDRGDVVVAQGGWVVRSRAAGQDPGGQLDSAQDAGERLGIGTLLSRPGMQDLAQPDLSDRPQIDTLG